MSSKWEVHTDMSGNVGISHKEYNTEWYDKGVNTPATIAVQGVAQTECDRRNKLKVFKLTGPLATYLPKFTCETAPYWITSCNTVEGSTMDKRWFWVDHVLTLKVGEIADNGLHKITRIR